MDMRAKMIKKGMDEIPCYYPDTIGNERRGAL